MTNLVKFTPFRELDRFFEDDFFMPVVGRVHAPAVDLYESGDEIVAEVSVPGFDPKKVNVEIENNVLHLKGEEEKVVVEDKSRDYYRKEFRKGAFSRSIALPVEVDSDKISAHYERGVLKVVMPKSEKVKPRKVDISIKE